jgi:polysaccharide biosynthesis transport protein
MGPIGPAQAAPGGVGSSMSLGEMLRLLRKHALGVLLLGILAPVTAGFWTARQPKVYQANTTIAFDFSQHRTLGQKVDVYDPYGDYVSRTERMETEYRVISSMRVARQVVVDAGLDQDPVFLREVFQSTPGKVDTDAIAMYLRGALAVSGVRGTSLASVTFEDSNPKRAQRLVATIVDTYIRLSAEDAIKSSGAALTWLNDQLAKLEVDLFESENHLHKYKVEHNLISVSLNDQSSLLREQINAYNAALTQANVKRSALAARAAALSKITTKNPDDLPASELLGDGVLQQLRTEYMKARTDLSVLEAAGKLESHPEHREAQQHLEKSLESFVAQVRNIQVAAQREASVVTSEAASLNGLLAASKSQALELNLQEIEYNRMNRTALSNEKIYQSVLERMKEVDLSRMMTTRNVTVVDAPLEPGGPIRPRVSVNIGIGAAIGLFLGLAFAVLRELADRTIKSPEDLETKLGITSLGMLPVFEEAEAGEKPKRRRLAAKDAPELIVHRQPNSAFAEAARSIRSNILFMAPDHPPRVILVTSGSPGEGKTTTTTALAVTFAQSNSRTLIVDLDLRRPRLHKVFGVDASRGASTALLGEPVEDAIHPTEVPNLFVLPAGPLPPNPAELLMSEKMNDLLADLRTRFDRVIIDSAPVNPVTDTVVLSTRVDGTVFVGRSLKSSLDQMRNAVRTIQAVNGRILGGVVNAIDMRRAEYRYSYSYRAYRYGGRGSAEST